MSTRHLVTNDQASGSEPGKQKGPWPETLFSISRWTIHLTNKKSCQWCRYTSIISSRETTCKWVAKQEMAELFAAALGPVSQKFTVRWRLCAEGLLGSTFGIHTCEKVERSRSKQMERWNCDPFSRGVSAGLMGSSGSKVDPSLYKSWGKGARSLSTSH